MTLKHCPRCDYSLQGLPEVHPCPECGLVCDRAAEVFSATGSRMGVILPFLFVLILGLEFLFGGLGRFSLPVTPWQWIRYVLDILSGVALLFGIAYLVFLVGRIRRRHAAQGMTVLPAGIAIKEATGEFSLLAWREVLGLTPERGKRRVWIERETGHVPLQGYFENDAAFDRLMEAAETSRTAWANGEDPAAGASI